jgi:hypothetical protein
VSPPEETEAPTKPGALRTLLQDEARLIPLLRGVMRLDASVYGEIADAPHATPTAFAVVIATAFLWGIGQTSPALIFFWIGCAIVVWCSAAALIWALGALFVPERAHYPRLLRCLGFAFAWNVLQIGAELPFFGVLFQWAALGGWAVSMTQATRVVLAVSTGAAVAVCSGAILLALGLLFAGAR